MIFVCRKVQSMHPNQSEIARTVDMPLTLPSHWRLISTSFPWQGKHHDQLSIADDARITLKSPMGHPASEAYLHVTTQASSGHFYTPGTRCPGERPGRCTLAVALLLSTWRRWGALP